MYLLKNYLAYFQYTNTKREERAENRSPNRILTNIRTQTALGGPVPQHLWSHRGPRQHVCSLGETSKIEVWGPIYNPRTDSN